MAVDERSRRIAARFELPMLAAALLVIPAIAIEQSDVDGPWEVIAMFVMVVGIGFVALLAAAAPDWFIRHGGDAPAVDERLQDVSARLAAIEQRLQ